MKYNRLSVCTAWNIDPCSVYRCTLSSLLSAHARLTPRSDRLGSVHALSLALRQEQCLCDSSKNRPAFQLATTLVRVVQEVIFSIFIPSQGDSSTPLIRSRLPPLKVAAPSPRTCQSTRASGTDKNASGDKPIVVTLCRGSYQVRRKEHGQK